MFLVGIKGMIKKDVNKGCMSHGRGRREYKLKFSEGDH